MTNLGKDDPWRVLYRAAWWLRGVGGTIAVAGIVGLVLALRTPADAWRILRSLGVIAAWLVPGLFMIFFSIFIPRRKRWAITGAEVTAYIQLFFAGALIVFSLLHIKGLWPMLVIGIIWIIPLLLTPRFTGPCSRAMDLIAQLVTLPGARGG